MVNKTASKRKFHAYDATTRKKAKLYSLDELPWTISSSGDDIGLEEVENVQVVYEDTDAGKVAKFKVIGSAEPEINHDVESDLTEVHPPLSPFHGEEPTETAGEDSFDANLLPNWGKYSLHPQLLKALHNQGYLSPTPIQAEAIPFALAGRDVVGVAETGSGKTLAYGLPILHRLLSQPRTGTSKRPLKALVLAPTRELALQVSSHLNTCLNSIIRCTSPDPAESLHTSVEPGSHKHPHKNYPRVSVAALVGGMSSQKQRRILARGVDVLVATPGRLWDVVEENDWLACEIKNLKFLVLDEADRMIEVGHFAELDNILRLTLRDSREEDRLELEPESGIEVDKGSQDEELKAASDLQTFVYSATLSKDLQRNLKRRSKRTGNKSEGTRTKSTSSTLDDLLLRLDFRDDDPKVIDISPVDGVVSTLTESKIDCLTADKDVYLYYFLLRYPGRSLVFLSSIDGIRRLMPLMELLAVKAFPLHSQLEQRQRLNNLDRFKMTPSSVLLATDIAARGLDITAVDHVIHYQIPRSADSYIHRNGRTARAMRKGFSMLMCAPDERRVLRALLGSLGRQDRDIPEMSIELDLLDKLKARVQLARQIDQSQHKIRKENHNKKWMRETADAMEIELDTDFASESDDKPSKRERRVKDAKVVALKAELKHLLAQPLIARGVLKNYITSGSTPIVDDLLAGEYNKAMLGMKTTEAADSIVSAKRKNRKFGKSELTTKKKGNIQ